MLYKKLLIPIVISLLLMTATIAVAEEPKWLAIIPEKLKKSSRKNFSKRLHLLFKHFISRSLQGKGKIAFNKITKKTKNNIFWKGKRHKNIYLDAFQRSYPSVKRYKIRKDIPEIVLLIPYLESLWQAKSGDPAADYGYWQLILPIVKEIQKLPTSPDSIKKVSANKIRSSSTLSTKVALLHLRRYYFYFAKVAKYNETDAWMFAILSYNWGAGNVKRILIKMKHRGIRRTFSNFYYFLYKKHKADKKNRSLKAAVEYLPSLWNIAKVIHYK